MYVVELCDNKTREACEILYIHILIDSFFIYVCIRFSLVCFYVILIPTYDEYTNSSHILRVQNH